MKFGFIGAGNMVSAIVKGMTANGYDGKNIFITSKTVTSAAKLAEACGANSCQTAGGVIAQSDVVVLGIKPHILVESCRACREISRQRNLWWCPLPQGKHWSIWQNICPKIHLLFV